MFFLVNNAIGVLLNCLIILVNECEETQGDGKINDKSFNPFGTRREFLTLCKKDIAHS